mmetsp:Transcript_137922/g.384640  ORF Transcript_137922/g.384640 Transcript_137922/m.384640 type:complete len:214 (+) Transcript_137922:171-812(+)
MFPPVLLRASTPHCEALLHLRLPRRWALVGWLHALREVHRVTVAFGEVVGHAEAAIRGERHADRGGARPYNLCKVSRLGLRPWFLEVIFADLVVPLRQDPLGTRSVQEQRWLDGPHAALPMQSRQTLDEVWSELLPCGHASISLEAGMCIALVAPHQRWHPMLGSSTVVPLQDGCNPLGWWPVTLMVNTLFRILPDFRFRLGRAALAASGELR